MAGIADTTTIDLVAQEADGTLLLVMVEERSWDADPVQASQLQQKINAYAGFVLDGTLAEHYPEAAGAPICIRLDCVEAPDGHLAEIVEHARAQLAALEIGFRVNVRR